MVMLKKTGQMDAEGGLRFVPVADEDDFLRSYRPGQANQGRLLRPATSIIPYSKLTRVQETDEAAGNGGAGAALEERDGGRSIRSSCKSGEEDDHDAHSSGSNSEELDLGIGAPGDTWEPKNSMAPNGRGTGVPTNPFTFDGAAAPDDGDDAADDLESGNSLDLNLDTADVKEQGGTKKR